MTTAARPTFLPAIGGNSFSDKGGTPTSIVRAKEQTAHTKLKQRHDLFGTEDESSPAELKRKLLEDEREHFEKERKRLLGPGALDGPEDAAKRRRMLEERNLDADDDSDDSDDSEDKDSDDDEDDDDEDEDDTAELLRELEKIKRERAEEQERLERERVLQEEREMEARAMTGNPLLQLDETTGAPSSSSAVANFTVKRRWDDDVIFKNQGRAADEQPKKRFINDMLRSDFHRKFMNKYVK